jgi:hypothetical protein
MLVLNGVYVENDYGGLRFHRVKAPNVDELKTQDARRAPPVDDLDAAAETGV